MDHRCLAMNIDYPTVDFSSRKRQFDNLKNRNSKEFMLKELRSNLNSPTPKINFDLPRPKHISPEKLHEPSFFPMQNRLEHLEKLRKDLNLRIFKLNRPQPIISDNSLSAYTPQPPIKRVNIEKFVESITYTKADLTVPSKFIPTDRNTNRFLEDKESVAITKSIRHTKKSPKSIRASPILGY
jgi:hypothetical protein